AFREIKEYLQLRPFFLRWEKRIRVHFSICVVGYLFFNAMEQKLRQHGEARSVTRILSGYCRSRYTGAYSSDWSLSYLVCISQEDVFTNNPHSDQSGHRRKI